MLRRPHSGLASFVFLSLNISLEWAFSSLTILSNVVMRYAPLPQQEFLYASPLGSIKNYRHQLFLLQCESYPHAER